MTPARRLAAGPPQLSVQPRMHTAHELRSWNTDDVWHRLGQRQAI
jgi:hypothetical protein